MTTEQISIVMFSIMVSVFLFLHLYAKYFLGVSIIEVFQEIFGGDK